MVLGFQVQVSLCHQLIAGELKTEKHDYISFKLIICVCLKHLAGQIDPMTAQVSSLAPLWSALVWRPKCKQNREIILRWEQLSYWFLAHVLYIWQCFYLLRENLTNCMINKVYFMTLVMMCFLCAVGSRCWPTVRRRLWTWRSVASRAAAARMV